MGTKDTRGSTSGMYARIYDSDGSQLTDEFQGNNESVEDHPASEKFLMEL